LVLLEFSFHGSDISECLASSTFGVDHAMALQLDVKIFDFSQVFGAASGNGRIVEEVYDRNQYSIQIEAVVSG
jgi:hypothetical protein